MKKLLPLFFFLAAINLYAQLAISGKIIDRETKQPIEGVLVQNKSHAQNVVFSDVEGRFSIQIGQGDSILFRCLGYIPVTVVAKHLGTSAVIRMEAESTLLNEVTIAYEDINKLLQKSADNLKKRLLTNTSIYYLWQGTEMEKYSGSQRDGHALYVASLTEKALSKKRPSFQLLLAQLKHTSSKQQISKVINDDKLSVGFHHHDFNMAAVNEYYNVVKAYSEDTSNIVIKCTPKTGEKGSKATAILTIYIQKKDTVLIAYQSSGIDSTLQLKKYKSHRTFKYKITHYQTSYSFHPYGNFYYLDQFYLNMGVSFLIKGKEELINNHYRPTKS